MTPPEVSNESLTDILAVTESVLSDPHAPARFAIPYLRRAWVLTLGTEVSFPEGIATLPQLPRRKRERFAASWQRDEAGEGPPRAEMLAQTRALRALGKRPQRRTLALAVLLSALVLLGLLALRASSGSVAMRSGVPTGPWRVEVFALKEFRGPSVVFRANDAAFEWKEEPHETMPTDKFGTRLSTCLELDRQTTLQFALIADAGARLFIDGKKVIEAWGKKNKLQRKTLKLAPCVHTVLVEHHDDKGISTVNLTASLDGGQPGPLPRGMLRYTPTGDC